MVSLHLVLLAFIAYFYFPGGFAYLRSFAALTLWIRLLRFIYLSQRLGSLVLLLVRMTQDMLRLMVLIGFIIMALTSALHVLLNDAVLDFLESSECADFTAMRGNFHDWMGMAFLLINSMIDGKAQDALMLCTINAGGVWALAWFYAYIFMLFVCLLVRQRCEPLVSRLLYVSDCSCSVCSRSCST